MRNIKIDITRGTISKKTIIAANSGPHIFMKRVIVSTMGSSANSPIIRWVILIYRPLSFHQLVVEPTLKYQMR